jgi:ornithine cyclodeaminase/alanine dehydrogenase-like protein (mu-crystallin family)
MTDVRPSEGVLYLSSAEVEAICGELDTVAVVREALLLHARGEAVVPDEAYLGWINGDGESCRSLNMPGHLAGAFRMGGTKVINANPANPARGLARASGLTLLYDDTTARIVCVLQAAPISSARTASVSALSAELLCVRPVERVAVIGAGAIARAHLELLCRRLDTLAEVRLFDLDGDRSAALARSLHDDGGARGVRIVLAGDAEQAIRGAQLVIPATTTTTGYIPYEWLSPGAVLVNISLDDALPDVMLRADLLLVDDWNLVRSDTRRLLGRMHRAGTIAGPHDDAAQVGSARRVDGELSDLLAGRIPGRRNDAEIVVVNPFGMSIEDVAVATTVYRAALARGLGTRLAA